MDLNHSPQVIYQQQKQIHESALEALKKKRNLLGWIRLALVLVAALVAYQVFISAGLMGWIVVAVGLILFLAAVSADADNNRKMVNTKNLIRINEEELKLLAKNYTHRYDGRKFSPVLHNYANDLDIFGKASLYQYVNRCEGEQGRALLADNFMQPLPVDVLLQRQEAVKELSPMYEWRQGLQAYAMETPASVSTQQKVQEWLTKKEVAFQHPAWRIIIPLYSVLTIASAIAAVLGYIPAGIFFFLFIIYFIIGGSFSKRAVRENVTLSGIVDEVSAMYTVVEYLEQKNFSSDLLIGLKASVQKENKNASYQIRRLKEILNRFDLRLNVFVFMFINSFLLWDLRQVRALNNWRKDNKELMPYWFRLIAEFEVLNSLATLHFNQPQWATPKWSSEHFTLQAEDLGHPLIPPAQRVASSFDLQGVAKIGLITGSNMAGKSTFLRSLGVNIVLAQMGAVVCAGSFVLSPMRIMSSMRIADDLSENTSTFYAELKKLKTIIEAVKRHERVFVLLDEILRGTNSLDRHTGSKALIRQLIKENAVAVIATHDVELAKLQDEYPQSIDNYHFDVQVEGEELYFDYKLKEGVCTSLNASILMKKIGIELNSPLP